MPLRREGADEPLSGDARRMRDALRYANYQAVGDAIGVSRSAVQKWAQGRQVSPYRLREVSNLLTPGPDPLKSIQAGVQRIEEELGALRAILEARPSRDAPSPDDPVGDQSPPVLGRTRGR